ncbi:hypothetical protein Scep_029497 [Stephania cephalantha]|uniref:EF-hand domain-containing protein n=1 Tax=Stephania cephalantha TaxID=152367 RepID=A0AAP0HFW9_9MAGN
MSDAILGVLFGNLNTLIQREFGLIWGVKHDLETLSSTLTTIQAVLEDAEAKQFNDKSIKNWLSKLKDAAYDADDILDEWRTRFDVDDHTPFSTNSCINQVPCSPNHFFRHLKNLVFRYRIAKEIKEMMRKFDAIAKERSSFNLIEWRTAERVAQSSHSSRVTSSVVNEPKIYGRESDIEKILHVLLGEGENVQRDGVLVCPIVGIGGLGKTTLAQMVYNDERVVKYFKQRMWVCVSEDFDVQRLTKLMIESLSGSSCDLTSLDAMQCKLREMLGGKKFLVVLDDVWNDNQNEWNKLKSSVNCGAEGSSIIVTTRLPRVASITSTIPPHELSFLTQNECWELFKGYAFGLGNEENPNLEKIGYEIVQKCGGVPLAAKALGSLLRFRSDETQWEAIRDSEIWETDRGNENMIMPALKLSYNNLSPDLRQCFAYCSVFPKDHLMVKRKLIYLWMANGFIQSDGRTELEDIGESVFSELVARSMFQDIDKDENGNIKFCKMHDLLHDLASFVAVNECLNMNVVEAKNISRKPRHLSMSVPDCNSISIQFLSSQRLLRALIFDVEFRLDISEPDLSIICRLKCLRVLSLDGFRVEALPSSIKNLIHLRYLDISGCSLGSLHEYFGHLRNLQMLDLSHNNLKLLPASFSDLEKMRFLNLIGNTNLIELPGSIGRLTNLRVMDMSRNKFKMLPSSIGDLGQLRFLSLSHNEDLISLPDSIGRLRNLQKLDLSKNKLKTLPSSIGDLEQLKLLNLSQSQELQFLPDSICGLINLRTLELRQCLKLKALPKNIGNMRNLRRLYNDYCHGMNEMPFSIGKLTCLEELEEFIVRYVKENAEENEGRDGAGIEELRGLNLLRGRLCIRRLERVRNSMDAKEANLISKENLSCLELSWWTEVKNIDHEAIIEALQPPSNIKELRVEGYPGVELPNWMKNIGNFVHLTEMELHELPNLEELPWTNGLTPTVSLQVLKLEFFPKLTTPGGAGLANLTSLRELHITACDSLTSLPKLGISSLVILKISSCEAMYSVSEGLQHLTSLQELFFWVCPELEFSAECFDHLISLRKLKIDDCFNLKELPDALPRLTAFRELTIRGCHPDLVRKCEKDKGTDWWKIAHISNVEIAESF